MQCPKHKKPLKQLFLHNSLICEDCENTKEPDYPRLLRWEERIQSIWHFYYGAFNRPFAWRDDPSFKVVLHLYRRQDAENRVKAAASPQVAIGSVRTSRIIREDEWNQYGYVLCTTYFRFEYLPTFAGMQLFGAFSGFGYNPRAG